MSQRIAAITFFVCVALAAIAPIHSYDYFWHIATGRWIVEHHALPLTDPFALASEKTPWINGEWLWQVGAYAVRAIAGDRGTSFAQALFVAAIFTIGFLFASRDHDWGIALLLAALAFAGAWDRLGVRPAAAAAMLIAIAVGTLARDWPAAKLAAVYAAITIVWINVHPSALLAPALAALTMLKDVRRWMVALASAVALLVNPFGWNGILAPIRLSSVASGGEYVNMEWLPSPIQIFPLLYITIVAVIVIFIFVRKKRPHWWRFAIFALLAVLAGRYVRNQSLYFAALPMLVPPLRSGSRKTTFAFAACAAVPLLWVATEANHATGTDPTYFPVAAVGRLELSGLQGNIYNVDQFGGYLIWTFYGQHRVLTDGRDELYRSFIAQDAAAHRDSRVWHAMQRQYNLNLAVDEYASPLQVFDVASGTTRTVPASLARYPRTQWALIAYDDAAMVFARRSAFPPEKIAAIEIKDVVPDANR